MTWKKFFLLAMIGAAVALGLSKAAPPVRAAPDISAAPLHAGCYLAKPHLCKIHVEPFTINVTSGQRLAQFQLVAIRGRDGAYSTIYDWRPDGANPAPLSGTAYTPSKVAKDFAATCGESYAVSLQGKDSGDANLYNLGVSGQFTCPVATYTDYLPVVRR